MNKKQLLELIDSKVNEVYLAFQEAENIKDGGISPPDAIELDNIEEMLADFIMQSMTYNR